MADIDVYSGLTLISSPAAGDRLPLGTGPGAGGYSLRGSFVWRDAAGDYYMSEPQFPRLIFERTAIGNWSLGYDGVPGSNGFALRLNGGVPVLCAITNGNIGIGLGNTPAAARFHVRSLNEIARFDTTAAVGGGSGYVTIYDASGNRKGFWGYGDTTDTMYLMNDKAGAVYIGTSSAPRWAIGSAGLLPFADNAYTLGAPGNRVSVYYGVTGSINTSDEREKTWRGAMSPAELSAAKRIAGELGFYQWNDAIAEKGADGARYHFGVRAQQVWAIMADEGLIDPLAEGVTPDSKYAFLCWDEWDEIAPVEAVEEVLDEGDNVVIHAQAAQPGRDAGDRFGIRTDQLALFLIAAQEARLAALEAAL